VKTIFRRISLGLWFPIALVVIWELGASLYPNPFFVRPSTIAATFPVAIDSSWWFEALLPTILLTLGGYLLGSVVGVLLGIFIGASPSSVRLLGPLAVFVRSTPVAATIPVILAIFGLGSVSLYVAVAMTVGFQVLLVTMLGISRTDSHTVEAARVLGMGRTATLFQVRLPAAMADVLVALHTALQTALLVAVTVEILAGGSGMGRFVTEALNSMRVAHLWVSVIVVGVLGVFLHEAFFVLERRLAPWYFRVKGI
jgi:sulfonate transport system permease protein